MAFWSQNIEPKRQNRWSILFSGDLQPIVFALKTADKPSYKINTVVHKFANHNFKYPGRVEWNTIPLKFASVTDPDAAQILYNIMLKSGYINPNQIFDGASTNLNFLKKGKEGEAVAGTTAAGTPSANGFVPTIGSVNLQQVDAAGLIIENWQIHSPFFTDVKFGTLDYGNDNIIDVECTMRFDWAELVVPTVEGQTGTAPKAVGGATPPTATIPPAAGG